MMKAAGTKSDCRGFTVLELLVVVIIVVVLAMMMAPTHTERGRPAYLVHCMSNQRQLVLGLMMFQQDYHDAFPWQLSVTNGGSMEALAENSPAMQLRTLNAYIKDNRLFVCPTDHNRSAATNLLQLVDANVSYFLNLDSTGTSKSVFTGDRHLEADEKSVHPGSFSYSTNLDLNWTHELHGIVNNGPIGVISFRDGHIQSIKGRDLNTYFRGQSIVTNRLLVP